MRKPIVFLSLLLTAGLAHAGDDFDARVARGHKNERSSPAGREYLMRFASATDAPFNAAVGVCARKQTPGQRVEFTVVFDVDATGSVTDVEVAEKDRSDYTLCYAEEIAKIKGPPPPESFAKKGVPMVLENTHTF